MVDITSRPQIAGTGVNRRRFLTYLIGGPALAIAARIGVDAAAPAPAGAVVGVPEVSNHYDLTDLLIASGGDSYYDLKIEITPSNRVRLEVPRMEVGQGVTTAVMMIVADELDADPDDMKVSLSPAEPHRGMGQVTGGSHSIRSLWDPARVVAAEIRARLITAAAQKWGLPAADLKTKKTRVIAPDGRTATYGSLTEAAAKITEPEVSTDPKPFDKHRVIGKPRTRIDARDIVTGKVKYAMDLPVKGALPTVVARPPTLGATVVSFDDKAARKLPGVKAVTQIPAGIAVSARTFGEAVRARDALEITWGAGAMDDQSDADIRDQLRAVNLPALAMPAPGTEVLSADFEFPYLPHAPMETMDAVADVSEDRAEIWMGAKMPIVALQQIAEAIGMPEEAVQLHVVQAGGSFGRRLFFDPGIEAAQVSKAIGKPVKLMFTRADDMKGGRCRPTSVHHIRATVASGRVMSFEHRMAGAEMDLRHGFGEAISASGGDANPYGYSQTVFHLTQKVPYNVGATSLTLHEVPFALPTAAWRCVYSGTCMMTNEIFIDEIARHLKTDEYEFRRALLDNDRAVAVLDKVAKEGRWGRKLPKGVAQGIGMHDEYKSVIAYLMEVDTRGPEPRVTKVTVAVDVGRPVNPRGIEAQLMGVTMDGISAVFRAGLHIDNGAVRENSFGDYHWTRMRHSPLDIDVHIMPANADVPGGIGELGLPASSAAAANAYARATGKVPRLFPILEHGA